MLRFDEKSHHIKVSLNSHENVLATLLWLRSQMWRDRVVIIETPHQQIFLRDKWKQTVASQMLKEMLHMFPEQEDDKEAEENNE